MEKVLNNQQVRPGSATQFMHAIFSSDDEMLTFYLTLNRFINQSSYLVERSDGRRLEDLANVLRNNLAAFEAVHNYKNISVKDVVRGFGMHMMNTQVSNAKRLQSADIVGSFIDCIVNTTKNTWQFKQMYLVNYIHLENVKYLQKRLNTESDEENSSKALI